MENKTLTEIEQRIKKGCGKNINAHTDRFVDDYVCGNNDNYKEKNKLCPTCKAKLQLITEIREVIENGLYEFFSKHEFKYIKINAGQRQDIMNDLNKELLGEQQNTENEE